MSAQTWYLRGDADHYRKMISHSGEIVHVNYSYSPSGGSLLIRNDKSDYATAVGIKGKFILVELFGNAVLITTEHEFVIYSISYNVISVCERYESVTERHGFRSFKKSNGLITTISKTGIYSTHDCTKCSYDISDDEYGFKLITNDKVINYDHYFRPKKET